MRAEEEVFEKQLKLRRTTPPWRTVGFPSVLGFVHREKNSPTQPTLQSIHSRILPIFRGCTRFQVSLTVTLGFSAATASHGCCCAGRVQAIPIETLQRPQQHTSDGDTASPFSCNPLSPILIGLDTAAARWQNSVCLLHLKRMTCIMLDRFLSFSKIKRGFMPSTARATLTCSYRSQFGAHYYNGPRDYVKVPLVQWLQATRSYF